MSAAQVGRGIAKRGGDQIVGTSIVEIHNRRTHEQLGESTIENRSKFDYPHIKDKGSIPTNSPPEDKNQELCPYRNRFYDCRPVGVFDHGIVCFYQARVTFVTDTAPLATRLKASNR
ncbi:MAG: hypothetical protein ROW48_13955 [Bellilinea sp.]